MSEGLKAGIGIAVGASVGFFIGYNILKMKHIQEDKEGEICCSQFATQFECENQESCPACVWNGGCHYPIPFRGVNYFTYYGLPGAVVGGIIGGIIGYKL